jgi:hypothetical protein
MKNPLALAIGLLLAMFLGACGKDSGDIKPSVSPQISENTTQDEEPWKPLDVCGDKAEFSEGLYFLKEILDINVDNFENYPKDIKCFVENVATCEHFSGEQGDNDVERAQQVKQALEKYCGDASAQAAILKKKYSQDTYIDKRVLSIFDTDSSVENNPNQNK